MKRITSPVLFPLFAAACFGFLGVAMGAFGAHVLRPRLAAALYENVQTAVFYQFVHALALFALGVLGAAGWRHRALSLAAGLWTGGVIAFCGSLYAYAFTQWWPLVWVTPLGGILLLAGWASFGLGVMRADGASAAGTR
ncbi:DUF423 domain-containing protein [Tepidiphilus margaritifer]|uniref:DUF423 domain-containing protein n=1 Tax=Tepidiphilus margaritifer TaxID=203471 RepID=UPI000414B8ED|nr:DUF423 domain-containing protein [Tepidiphilus margaritifer]